MKSLQTRKAGFTLIELLVVIAIIAILAALAVPQITSALVRGQLTQTVSNAKQVYLAALNMGNDNAVSGDEKLGWPGDLAQQTGAGTIGSASAYVDRMVEYDYVKRGDLGKIFAAPGVKIYNGTGQFGKENSAFDIYKAKQNDVGAVIFLATRNFSYGGDLKIEPGLPYGDKGFVVFRRGGDGFMSTSKAQSKLKTPVIGLMPDATDFDNPGEASSEKILSWN